LERYSPAWSRPASGGQSDLQKWIETPRKAGGRIQALPEVEAYETYVYSARGCARPSNRRRGHGQRPGESAPELARNREFLEGFSLDTLRMVGTFKVAIALWLSNPRTASCTSSAGQLPRQNTASEVITGGKISLVEIIPDGLGGYIERPASLALSD